MIFFPPYPHLIIYLRYFKRWQKLNNQLDKTMKWLCCILYLPCSHD